MSINRLTISGMLALVCIVSWSVSSRGAVIVTSGNGHTAASASGNYTLPGIGNVSGSDSFNISLPGGGTHTTTYDTYHFLPPGVFQNPIIAGGVGTAQLTVFSYFGGLTAIGKTTASRGRILGVGGGTGEASSSVDVFFTITNNPGVFDLETIGASSTNGSASLTLEMNGSTLLNNPSGNDVDMHMLLNPGDYHLTFEISANGGQIVGSNSVSFEMSIVPEVSNVVMTSAVMFLTGTCLFWRNKASSHAKLENVV